MSTSASSSSSSNHPNKSSIQSLNLSKTEITLIESNQKQKTQEGQDQVFKQINDQDEDEDYKRRFSLNSISRNSLISVIDPSIHSFSPPTRPPFDSSNHLETTLTSNLQYERLLTGLTSNSESLMNSKSYEEKLDSTEIFVSEKSDSIQLPLRKHSDPSTIWRSSLASVNESFVDLSDLPPKTNLSDKIDSISQSSPLDENPPSRRDDRHELSRIENLNINLTQDEIEISKGINSNSSLTNHQDLNDKSLNLRKKVGSTGSETTSPRTPTSKSFIIHSNHQSSSFEENESTRKSLIEGRHKLIENFTTVQEEITGTVCKVKPTNLIKEEKEEEKKELIESNIIIESSDHHQKEKENQEMKSSLEDVSPIDWDFWGSVMNDYEEVAKKKPKELSKAIQSGIPPALRGMMWQLMSSSKDVELEIEYSRLLNLPCQYEKSITRDLNRTFPQLEYFKESGGIGQDSLLSVCKAFSLYDEEVGYTQGLQFIIGPMLLNMPDEEAFCVLVRLMDSYDLRSHFIPNMPGLQLRLFQFDRILEDLLPHVYMHLLRQGIKSSMYASQWFLTLFGYRFPLELVSVVMDLVFAEGIEAVFKFGLSLMKKNEKEICEREFDKLLDFLKLNLFEPYKNDDSLKEDLNLQPFSCDSDSIPKAAVVNKRLDQSNNNTEKRKGKDSYRSQEFIKDALQIKITPMMLDQYSSEWESICKEKNAHQIEINRLRDLNAQLSAQVKRLENNLAQVNEEHCDLVKQVVMAKLDREELEEELVKYKMAFADLSHQQASEGSKQHRASSISTHSFGSNGPHSFHSDSH